MASLERNGKGWRYVWRENGTRKKSKTFKNKLIASRKMDAFEKSELAKKPLHPGKVLAWSDLVDRYVASRSDRTESHQVKAKKTLTTLGADHGWKSAGQVSPASCERLLPYHGRMLRALLRYAAETLDQAVDARVLRIRQKKSPKKPADLLTDDQLATLLAAAATWHPSNAILAHMIARYGHRAESLVALTCSSLTDNFLTLRVKSGDTHRHPLLAEDIDLLHTLTCGRPGDDAMFIGHLGRPWAHGSEFAAWWGHQVASSAPFPSGRKPGILDLRRLAITGMLDHIDAKTTASITGHRTVSLLLDTYARTNEERQRNALLAIEKAPKRHLKKS
jgi:integrase